MGSPIPDNKAPAVMGRPSGYKPEYCEQVEQWGAEGKSRRQIAALLRKDAKTLRDWAGKYPDFSLALARAKEWERAWWENAGQLGLLMPKFNAALWDKNMRSRFRGSDWDDKSEKPEDEQHTQQETNLSDIDSLTDEQLESIAAGRV